MPTAYDVDRTALNKRIAAALEKKEEIEPPEWAMVVKTGVHKERPPVALNWWFERTAAVLTSVYMLGPIGVNKLRTKFGGKKNRGHKPERFYRGSGAILRNVLQQLEKAGLVKQTEKGVHKGRIVTSAGMSFVDKLAGAGYEKVSTREEPVEKKTEDIPKESDKPKSSKPVSEQEKTEESKNTEDTPKNSEKDSPEVPPVTKEEPKGGAEEKKTEESSTEQNKTE